MQSYRNDRSYPIDIMNDERNIKVKDNSNDWKYILAFFGIIFLIIVIFIVNLFIPNDSSDNEKENKIENVNVNETVIQTVTETDDGYKEEYICYTTIKDKKVVIKSSGSRMYLISCNDNVLNDYEYIEIGIQLYNGLDINDNVKIIKTIYYDKNDNKLYCDEEIEKINKF